MRCKYQTFSILLSKINVFKIIFTIPFILLATVLNSCDKAIESELSIEKELDPVTLKFSVRNLDDESHIDMKGYDTYNFLGYGYDVTGKYSHVTSVKVPVVDIIALAKDQPTRLDVGKVPSSSFRTINAVDALDLTKQLAHGENHYNYFGGSITYPFPSTDLKSDDHIYGMYDTNVIYERLTMFGPDELFVSYLTKRFKEDLALLEPKQLVEKYGTHVLMSIYTGAKLSIDFQAKYQGENRLHAVENSFRMALKDCFGLFSGFLDPLDSTALRGVVEPKIVFETIGGDPSLISIDYTSTSSPWIKTSDWQKSITRENAKFVYIDRLENLLPIYTLIVDAKKRQEVEKYIRQYIKANSV